MYNHFSLLPLSNFPASPSPKPRRNVPPRTSTALFAAGLPTGKPSKGEKTLERKNLLNIFSVSTVIKTQKLSSGSCPG